jgi:ornithine cyclodeaminase/alanine dehydrogenase-like protein (mu-crystallin family)
VRDIEKLYLYSIDPIEKREAFRDSLKNIIDCEILLAEDLAQAVGEASIVTIITSAKDPIVDGDWFKPGTHINGIGSHAPAGEWSWSKVHGSLGDVIAGDIPGRENDEEITLFKSVGLAIQDISTAFHVHNKATEMGVGSDFKF